MSSSPSSSVIEARKALASRLVGLRKDAGLTGDELSARCGWHPAKTSRIQSGKSAPSEDDLRAWCTACGAGGQVPDLIAAARAVDSMYTEWRRMERTGLRAAQESVAALYRRTGHFRVYASRVLPGMVQTPEYTTAVLRSIQRARVEVDDVADAVEARLERQRMLFSGRHRFGLLIEEWVLRAAVCDPETMAAQLGHLLAVSASPFVSVGVIPTGHARPHLPVEDFYLFDEDEVAVELTSGYLRITQPREIADYVRTFTDLASMAVHGAGARQLITAAITTLG
ncbi:helix-turn-helix transcriptional regulator [Kitasatospora sp. NBC_00240]|uniref:helix-turn-helix domain-containing protein n=1 Tax=Kitasatospora sp. NBC_00240 TaxID=2903567 RepID=UPI00224E3F0C|nr:helix-turn-helix transcriptional regulator [Kitasatospora sp. NBC_00240]MCX5215589.1 helix-turn-helix transcriptional regulator [Kitasatospora sp. NBC_00240]